MHVFTSCDKTRILWNELSLHIYRKTSERVGFNVANIILGEIPLSIDNKAMNFIILICLMQSKEPNLVGLLCHLKLKYHVEKYAAIQKFKMHNFDKSWVMWKNIFD